MTADQRLSAPARRRAGVPGDGAAPTDQGPPRSPAVELRGVTLGYGEVPVVRDLDLRVGADEVVAVLGPSGSGKSTLLAAVAGFLPVMAGEIRLHGRVVSAAERTVAPEERRVGMVFQHYALWPHLSALDTVAYPLRRRGMRRRPARRRAMELLKRMALGELADRRPAQLSGGQQQRVGLARALAGDPTVYLFDEPTAHLDPALRGALQDEMAARRRAGAAAVYATHDAAEALAVADRIALLRDGRIVQLAAPAQIYERPVDLWAAQLTGPASALEAPANDLGDGRLAVAIAGRTLHIAGGAADGTARTDAAAPAVLLVRPEWARLGGDLPGVVERVRYRGAHTDYAVTTSAGTLDVREPGPPTVAVGQQVTWRLERAWIAQPRR